MINAPEKIWDFWPIDGGPPVLWREPCPFAADDAFIVEYTRADTHGTAKARIAKLEAALRECSAANTRAFHRSENFYKMMSAVDAVVAAALEAKT
jgi:hypothetical protein